MAIQNHGGIGVKSDLWTDNYKQKYHLSCTLRAHWILNDSWQNSAIFFKLFKFSGKTAKNIKHELVSNLEQFKIEPDTLKCISFVTDRGANIKKALEEFSWLPRCCHTLNVALSRAFKLQRRSSSIELHLEEIVLLEKMILIYRHGLQ